MQIQRPAAARRSICPTEHGPQRRRLGDAQAANGCIGRARSPCQRIAWPKNSWKCSGGRREGVTKLRREKTHPTASFFQNRPLNSRSKSADFQPNEWPFRQAVPIVGSGFQTASHKSKATEERNEGRWGDKVFRQCGRFLHCKVAAGNDLATVLTSIIAVDSEDTTPAGRTFFAAAGRTAGPSLRIAIAIL